MKLTPDKFPPVMPRDLREFWRAYPDPNVRRLILEVHRAREVLKLTRDEAQAALYALGEQRYDYVRIRLTSLSERIFQEDVRLGSQGGIPVDVGRPK